MSTLTVAKILELAAQADQGPPIPFLASAAMLPNDTAYRFTFDGQEYVGAGPGFWAKFPRSPFCQAGPAGVTVHDLDAIGMERDRARFFRALAGAMGMPSPAPGPDRGCRGIVHTCNTIA